MLLLPSERLSAVPSSIQSSSEPCGVTCWSDQPCQMIILPPLVYSIDNNSTAAFSLAGSAALTNNFSGTNLTGQRINGVQVGGLFRF